ncbi:germacrene A synthase-like [Andrographis paniculata]|uniref:germacrene A synthase-like n=1 Tax=Andrographis paniculata TaxID=175694 RepID=UPI0021E98665|nr:germacrene A synthase-like [Andrographis paniculata]
MSFGLLTVLTSKLCNTYMYGSESFFQLILSLYIYVRLLIIFLQKLHSFLPIPYNYTQESMASSPNHFRRPLANFSPSLWGEHFLKHNFDSQVLEKHKKEIEGFKDEVRSQLSGKGIQMIDTMNLIDTLERLGIAYHFQNEIAHKLQEIFNLNTNYDDETYDLYTVALHFRLFRQHGHHISCDIFCKWIDKNGNFQERIKNDVRGLLSLYEATHLRIHGETILDDAFTFAATNLKTTVHDLEPSSPLRKQVVHALVQSLHLGCPRIEARNFISIYEEDECNIDFLLRFAKFDYNQLQILHKEELQEVSRWWKELNLISKYSYARDRVVECFFWATGVYYEPQYSRARVMLAKLIAMTSIMDDTYDAYGTVEELEAFTKAIERWDISEIDQLPEYIKDFYKAFLELYQQIEAELEKEGRSYTITYAIDALKELARSYNVEAKWFIQGEYPSFTEYLNNGLISCSYYYHTMVSLLGMKFATKNDFECLYQKPKMLIASLINCRLTDDVASYEVEKERGQMVTGIECYMKDNDVTKERALYELGEMAKNAWKDINQECLKMSLYSKGVVERILNMSRLIDVAYKNNQDGYTHPQTNLKPHILALFVNPVPI